MQKRTENFGAQLPFTDSPQRTLFKRSTTCLPKITFILQDAPCKMLTFSQLMDKMAPLICEDRKALENKLRICLSRNKCFVKVPDLEHTYRNYWKLDYSQITAKMVRRHFIGILHFFPELASIVRTKKFRLNTRSKHQPAACRAVQVRSEVKFSSPFSIESLLKRDSPSAQASTASPPSSVTLRAEQQQLRSAGIKRSFSWDSEERLLLQPPSGSSSISSAGGSTYHGATAAGAAESIRRMSECSEASFPVYTRARAAPYFSIQHSSYIISLYQHLPMMLSSSNVFYL
uniref:Fork-head domain-containing protein n=1 Tax=Amphiprion percula TaxID=161767 RepID=A0A3P8TFH0_AMPPE